ncbi:MAG: TIGR02584 family CRISPR-associated protein [Acidobacteria bacterium]|nr:TIGR02584 family CRISPR-associated protein [Acidobacteriota bacterium]
MAQSYRTTLLAVMGISPAILTETVWALAVERRLIPEEVLVLTTTSGREAIRTKLFHQGGWNRLLKHLASQGFGVKNRLRFGPSNNSIRVFSRPDETGELEDLVSSHDSRAAGDFILRVLRGYTEDPETRLIASLAGGRKTMSALLTSCMTLLARPHVDLLCHVLVNPPYDSPNLRPPFLFPEPGMTHRIPDSGVAVRSVDARIELVDVPFVRLRQLYRDRFRNLPPSFSTLVDQVQGILGERQMPEVILDESRATVEIDGRQVKVTKAEFALLLIVARRLKAGRPWSSWHEIGQELDSLRQKELDRRNDPEWLCQFKDRRLDVKSDVRKWASSLRAKLGKTGDDPSWVNDLLPDLKKGDLPRFPAQRLRIVQKA